MAGVFWFEIGSGLEKRAALRSASPLPFLGWGRSDIDLVKSLFQLAEWCFSMYKLYKKIIFLWQQQLRNFWIDNHFSTASLSQGNLRKFLNLRFYNISFNIRGTDIKLLDNFREVAFHYLQDEFSFPLAEWRVSFSETKLQKKTHYYCQNREN